MKKNIYLPAWNAWLSKLSKAETLSLSYSLGLNSLGLKSWNSFSLPLSPSQLPLTGSDGYENSLSSSRSLRWFQNPFTVKIKILKSPIGILALTQPLIQATSCHPTSPNRSLSSLTQPPSHFTPPLLPSHPPRYLCFQATLHTAWIFGCYRLTLSLPRNSVSLCHSLAHSFK